LVICWLLGNHPSDGVSAMRLLTFLLLIAPLVAAASGTDVEQETSVTVSPDKIEAMDGNIQENADDIVRVESKAERIAQIMMED